MPKPNSLLIHATTIQKKPPLVTASASSTSSLPVRQQPAPAPAPTPTPTPAPTPTPTEEVPDHTIRNLTHEVEVRRSDPRLQKALLERTRTEESLRLCERALSDLQIKRGTGVAHGGTNADRWADSFEKAKQYAHAAANKRDVLQQCLESARRRVKQLSPGPELLDANAALSDAHSAAADAERESEKAQRTLNGIRANMDVFQQLQTKEAECTNLKDKLSKLRSELQMLQDALAPLEQELREASDCRRDLPPAVIHVQGKPGLKTKLESGKLILADVESLIFSEWAVKLNQPNSRSDDENFEFQFLPLRSIATALQASTGREAACEVVLAIALEGQQERYFSVLPSLSNDLQARAAGRPVAKVPICLDLLRAALGLADGVELHPDVRDAVRLSLEPKSHPVPGGLKATLRPYQVAGFRWLATNAENGIGCLLADDMGLGKTLQSVALLLHLHAIGHIGDRSVNGKTNEKRKPALVVAPFSVLSCWTRELAQWAPCLRTYLYHGTGRSLAGNSSANTADVVLTTYATLQKDQERISQQRDVSFGCIVLDESQAIKNPKSRTAKAAVRVAHSGQSSCLRVALSGTPVENRLAELHSLFEFLNPGFLGPQKEFVKMFERPLEKSEADREKVHQVLNEVLHPFILRRTKMDKTIAPELPEKLELVHTVHMTTGQMRLYSALAEESIRRVVRADFGLDITGKNVSETSIVLPTSDFDVDPHRDGKEQDGVVEEPSVERENAASSVNKSVDSRRRCQVLSMLHGLQQACNHPAAVSADRWPVSHRDDADPSSKGNQSLDRTAPEFKRTADSSGKMSRLIELLEEILEPPQEKVLIFTQYRQTQDLIAELVEATFKSVKALRFNGSLNRQERDKLVRIFSEDSKAAVMILTLQSGGVGLTLTAATHVIHFDRCWNPAKEAQATDRAHRIGQHRTVVVHRLITVGTFEERLAAVLGRKRQLAAVVVPEDCAKVLVEMSDSELRELFGLQTQRRPPAKRTRRAAGLDI